MNSVHPSPRRSAHLGSAATTVPYHTSSTCHAPTRDVSPARPRSPRLQRSHFEAPSWSLADRLHSSITLKCDLNGRAALARLDAEDSYDEAALRVVRVLDAHDDTRALRRLQACLSRELYN